ncbi:MAG TPA: VWA domain-containing protein [Thermoanaerobaculia bacterium]|jgi:VWFA-related protein|nr:VWA domain-containing protein [Thermoanaerobaculia bacterium]
MDDRALLLLFLLTVASPGRGQAPAAPEAPATVQVFEEAVDVRVVNLEAVVTGAKGERMPGLKAADFRLRVDGVEMPISFFAEIDEKTRRLPGAVSDETSPEGSSAPVAETTWQSRNILVFLDETTMVKSRRDFVVRSLVQQLGRLGPGDRMAVVAFDGTRLAVLSDWTDDRARLSATFAAIEVQRPTLGIQGEASRRQEANNTSFVTQVMGVNESAVIRNSGELMVDSPETLPSDVLASGIVKQHIPFQGILPANLFHPDDRAVEVGEAVASAMRGMPTAPGRKMLLLLTEGFPGSAFGRAAVYEANRMGYSLYPVDVQGLDSFQVQNDVEFDKARPSRLITTARDRNRDQTLEAMAKATGGRASLNSDRLTALDDLVEDSAVYYLLGFSPAWRGNDRRHKIELPPSGRD